MLAILSRLSMLRHLDIIAILFKLGRCLTIGLIHVIVLQQIQKVRCEVACTVAMEKYPTEKSLVV